MMAFLRGVMKVKRNLMSPEQGTATTVWAAVGRDLEGKGGKYLERCGVGQPYREGFDVKIHDIYMRLGLMMKQMRKGSGN